MLSGNSLTHVVSFNDMDKLPVKLCLFAPVTGFEAECIQLFSQGPVSAEAHLARLPVGRYEKARGICQERQRAERTCSPQQIMQATEFIDKTTMLLREPTYAAWLPFSTKREAEVFFNRLQDLRNRVAHSDSIRSVLRTPREFVALLDHLREVTRAVTALTDRGSSDGDGVTPAPDA